MNEGKNKLVKVYINNILAGKIPTLGFHQLEGTVGSSHNGNFKIPIGVKVDAYLLHNIPSLADVKYLNKYKTYLFEE